MKILLIRNGRAGDIVMCTPALCALHDYYPSARFSFLTSFDGKRLLKDFSDRIDEFWIYNRKNPFQFLTKMALRRKIKSGNFDLVFNMEWNETYARLAKASSGAIYNMDDSGGSVVHYAQLLLDMVSRSVGKDVGFYPASLKVTEQGAMKAKTLLENAGIGDDAYVVSLHPTYSGTSKLFNFRNDKRGKRDNVWPTENYGELGLRLANFARDQNVKVRVLMNLMADDLDIGNTIVRRSNGNVHLLCPPPDIQSYLAYLKRVNLFVAPNTGPMHMAAAVGTDMVALFSGLNPDDCGPFVKRDKCTILRAEETNNPNIGLAAISVEQVFNACLQRIEKWRS